MPAFTPRNVAKYVVKTIVHSVVEARAEDAIINHTRYEEGDLVVKLSSHTVGWFVSDKLKPYTDAAVDKTADWYNARKEEKSTTE